MYDELKSILFKLRSKYKAKIRISPNGGKIIWLGDETPAEIAQWLLTHVCGCRMVEYESLKVIFIEKEARL